MKTNYSECDRWIFLKESSAIIPNIYTITNTCWLCKTEDKVDVENPRLIELPRYCVLFLVLIKRNEEVSYVFTVYIFLSELDRNCTKITTNCTSKTVSEIKPKKGQQIFLNTKL